MSKRREFSRAVKVEIIRRATVDGVQFCEREGCRALCKPGAWEINHRVMDAMEVDKSRRLTAEDGELLCSSCHKAETKAQMPALAEARSREQSHLGARRRPKQPMKPVPSDLKGPVKTHEGRSPVRGLTPLQRQLGVKI